MRPKLPKASVRRAIYALLAVVLAEVVGTVGFHVIEGAGWINAFYFESMLATGQGPPFALNTNAGKIFASVMGFVSVGSVLSAVVFTIGPIMVRIWHEGLDAAQAAAHRFEQDVVRDVRELGHDLSGGRTRTTDPPRARPRNRRIEPVVPSGPTSAGRVDVGVRGPDRESAAGGI